MINVFDLPCIRDKAEAGVGADQVITEQARAAASGLAPPYPSKSLVLQNGQFRVADSEK